VDGDGLGRLNMWAILVFRVVEWVGDWSAG